MTVIEQARALREIICDYAAASEDKTLVIAVSSYFQDWTWGKFVVGDVRLDPENGRPYECFAAHDSTVNTDWTIKSRTLWKPYHSRRPEYALPWEAPTGAHDMYLSGEYMVWRDGSVYRCKQNTSYDPELWRDAWEVVE